MGLLPGFVVGAAKAVVPSLVGLRAAQIRRLEAWELTLSESRARVELIVSESRPRVGAAAAAVLVREEARVAAAAAAAAAARTGAVDGGAKVWRCCIGAGCNEAGALLVVMEVTDGIDGRIGAAALKQRQLAALAAPMTARTVAPMAVRMALWRFFALGRGRTDGCNTHGL